MKYTLDFKNKNVLITGAASGIGLECTVAFLQNNATVYMADINKTELEKSVEGLKKEFPEAEIVALTADITSSEDVSRTIKTIRENGGRVDILVNNAGISHTSYSTLEKEEDWSRVITLNLTSQFFVAQAVANEFFIPEKQGKIINMCSLGGILGIPSATAYSASKGGVMQMTKSLACEWARFGITVNAVCPGFVDTPLIEKQTSDERWMSFMTSRTPMRRLAKPEDVAGTVLFLSSDMAEFITGASIIIDGGFSSGS